jgi:putative lipoprotein
MRRRLVSRAGREGRDRMKRLLLAATALCVIGIPRYAAMALPPVGSGFDKMPGALILSGTVSVGERTKLPGMATVHVELLDISGKDPRASTLGEQTIWPASTPMPVSFRIAYDPSRINPEHVYIVRARIMDGEKLLYINIKPYYVLTKGAPRTIDIIVAPAQVRMR